MPKYRDYRRYGHGPLTAATLATHPAVFYGTIAVIAVLIGLFS
jgi:hypothetical protein